MPSLEPFRIFTRKLEDLELRYMVSGSVAAIFYGEPRLTNDVDIILMLAARDARRIADSFPNEEFYCPPADVIALELSREQRGHFNLIHHETGFKADLYLIRNDPLHLWAIRHTLVTKLDDDVIRFAPPEYVIIRKLQFFREGQSAKHLRDISRMLASMEPEWDRKTLLDLIREYGLDSEWALVQEREA
ncbi:MAG: hypothetical protein AAGI48_01060 [Verrucomicrobiota bacterium]